MLWNFTALYIYPVSKHNIDFSVLPVYEFSTGLQKIPAAAAVLSIMSCSKRKFCQLFSLPKKNYYEPTLHSKKSH